MYCSNAQPTCLVLEPELKTSQPRRIDQGDELELCAPGIVGSRHAVEPQAKDPIPGDSPSGQNFHGFTLFAGEALDWVPEQGSDAHWWAA
jgi:hypothetical protein